MSLDSKYFVGSLLKGSVSVTDTSVIFEIVTTLYTFTSPNRYDFAHPQHFLDYTFRDTLFLFKFSKKNLLKILLVSKPRS